MPKLVIITGANGQLGRELQRTAPLDWQVIAATRELLDVTDAAAVSTLVSRYRPDVIINAAAYTAVDRAESEAALAHAINAQAPVHLAAAARAVEARLLHVSTDFVFDGRQGHAYAVDAPASPLSTYGRSKRAGEEAVLAADVDALVLRTGWLYSRFGANFVKTLLRLLAEREQLQVVDDQVGSPTWAYGLAQALWHAADRPALRGLYHWTDAGVCSWYDFAVAIAEEGQHLGLLQRVAAVTPIGTADYATAAQRPAFSVLDKRRSWADLEMPAIHWRAQLRTMLAELAAEPREEIVRA
jgi:dTDP-4-dehydrorhamnose reductase